MWHLYILECSDGSYYTGITNDVSKRLEKHNSGQGAKYTRSRRPCKIVYIENSKSETKARKREIEIKRWPREKKKDLISMYASTIS